jgi:hypothetical protein
MLDHTADLGQMKQNLAEETNFKTELWNMLIKQGEQFNLAQQEVLKEKNKYMQIKTQIRMSEDKIKTLKTIIKAEQTFGG